MKKIRSLIILFFLFAPTVVFANGEDETPQNEELTADSLEKLHIDLEAANKKIKEKSYAESRGMITRDAMKTVFIPKGQWMVGGQVAWNQWDTKNMNPQKIAPKKQISKDPTKERWASYINFF